MQYALITGASKGIGKDIAHILAAKAYNLILIARSQIELDAVKNDILKKYHVDIYTLAIDLTTPQACDTIVSYIQSQNLGINILVNNAGYGMWGYFNTLSIENQLNMMVLNNQTLVALTYKMLPVLRAQPQSYILNIASTAAYQAVPSMAVYSASKAFVVTFSRALSFEMQKTKLSVTCVSPGATATNFTDRAGMQAMQAIADKFNMPSEVVAHTAVKAMFSKKTEVVVGFVNQISAMATYILPKKLIETMAAGIYLKKLS
ncbi:MAG: SDR family oxidoreductase [Cytophagales bacterium]|nr:SDR family oxidoreductase [Cytophagales bacterium]